MLKPNQLMRIGSFFYFYLMLGLIGLSLIACGGNKVRADLTTAERLEYAMKLFQDRDYYDARTQFRIVVLNAPGSVSVDQAQFYLAECHFHMEEFITAAAEYEKVIRLYSRSEFLDDAQFKIGLAYYELSPQAALDQKYTWKAIEELQKFLEDYPESEHKEKATDLLLKIRTKLAKKEFNSADLYRKLGYYESALIYFDEVLNRYYDTEYAEPALFFKALILYRLERYTDARETLYQLTDKYRREQQRDDGKSRKPKFASRAQTLLRLIDQKLSTNGEAKK